MPRALFASVAASGLAAALALSAGCGGSSSPSDSHTDAATPGDDVDSGGHVGEAGDGGACSCGLPFPVAPSHASACASCVASQCASAVSQCTAVCCPATDDTCANGGIAPLTQCATNQCPADCSP